MPRETVDPKDISFLPALVDQSDGTLDVDLEQFPPQSFPEVEVYWDRTGGDVSIGLRTREPMAGTSTDLAEISVVRHVYGTKRKHIGEALQALLAGHGRGITDELADPQAFEEHDVVLTDELLGELVLRAMEAASPYSSWHTFLDRRGLNRFIAILKKAGAASFGRDQW